MSTRLFFMVAVAMIACTVLTGCQCQTTRNNTETNNIREDVTNVSEAVDPNATGERDDKETLITGDSPDEPVSVAGTYGDEDDDSLRSDRDAIRQEEEIAKETYLASETSRE